MNSMISRNKFSDIFKDEYLHQLTVSSNILKKFGMKHIIKKINSSSGTLNQNSNVLSYYFLKIPLTLNYKEILNKYPLGCRWEQKKIENLHNFIYSTLFEIKFDSYNGSSSLRMTK